MNTFTDTQGREWTIELDFAKLRKIKKHADLGNIEQIGRIWSELLIDDQKALAVIWLALDADVSEDEWLAAMNGETLEAARDALLGALENFTPAKRAMIAASAAKIHNHYKQAIQEATRLIETLTDETIEAFGTSPSSAKESLAPSTIAGR